MHIVLNTPHGRSIINVVKTNSIDLIVNKIVVSFTSEKSPDLIFVYDSSIIAKNAFDAFISSLHWNNQ